MKLDSYQISHLADFVSKLNKAAREHRVNVCAYGGIDIEVGEGNYVRLDWDQERGEYFVGLVTS